MNAAESPRFDVPEIEKQHARQVDLVRAFREALEREQGSHEAGRILDELRDCSVAHFRTEQALMRQRAYSGHEAHAQEHQRLLEHLDSMKGALTPESPQHASFLAEALGLWLTVHFQTFDHTLAAFLREARPVPGK